MACCPPTAHGYLAAEYASKGTEIAIGGDVDLYTVGAAIVGGTCVIICPDVFGYAGGRTRAIADEIVDSGTADFVLVPKLLSPGLDGGIQGDGLPAGFDFKTRGAEFFPFLTTFGWESSWKAKLDAVVAHAKAAGAARLGLLGFCFGGMLASLTAADPAVKALVVCHPTLQLNKAAFGGPPPEEMVASLVCPIFFMPAGDDPATYMPGGETHTALARNPLSKTEAYPEMKHGWVVRGDVADPAIARDAAAAVAATLAFLKTHLGA
jgi:dienelactone hydrolase